MWVNCHKINNSLVVFIHGIFGKRWATWMGVPDSLQEQFPNDPLLRSYDIFLYQYDTTLLRQPPLNPYVVDEFAEFLRQLGNKYKTTILIAHSQGGIVAKLYVLNELLKDRGNEITVDRIITLGTPHRGVRLLNPLYWSQQIPLLGRLIPFRQAGQLASWGSNIQTLKKCWNDKYINKSPCPPTARKRYIHSLAVVGAYDRVVGEDSAAGFAVDTKYHLAKSHVAIAKVNSVRSRVAAMIHRQLQEHLDPKEIKEQIRKILVNDNEMDFYLKQYSPLVSEKVKFWRPRLAALDKAVETKTASVLTDFLHDFPQRPLRGLTFEEALNTYVERQLGDGK